MCSASFRPEVRSLCAQRLTSPDSGGQACFSSWQTAELLEQEQARHLRGQEGLSSNLALALSHTEMFSAELWMKIMATKSSINKE